MLKIYDTKLREKVPFESLEHGKIGMYVCGPTVYNYIHIWQRRTFVSFDVILPLPLLARLRREVRLQYHRRR